MNKEDEITSETDKMSIQEDDFTSTTDNPIPTPDDSVFDDGLDVNSTRLDTLSPGKAYKIIEVTSGRAITFTKDNDLCLEKLNLGPDTRNRWLCVHKDGYYGLQEPWSGKYMGFKDENAMHLFQQHIAEKELMTIRRQPNGGFQMMVPHKENPWMLQTIVVVENGKNLAVRDHGETLWRFEEATILPGAPATSPRILSATSATAAIVSEIPSPGTVYRIIETTSGRVLTRKDNSTEVRLEIRVVKKKLTSVRDRWLCVENDGFYGFQELASGKYLGYDTPGFFSLTNDLAMVAKQDQHKRGELMTLRPHSGGGYQMMIPTPEGRKMKVVVLVENGNTLAARDHGITVWRFVKA